MSFQGNQKLVGRLDHIIRQLADIVYELEKHNKSMQMNMLAKPENIKRTDTATKRISNVLSELSAATNLLADDNSDDLAAPLIVRERKANGAR